MRVLNKIIKDILTGKDNKTYDVGRVLVIMFSIAYIIHPIIAVICGHDFNDQDWAIGAAAIMSGAGALLYLKKDTEPDK